MYKIHIGKHFPAVQTKPPEIIGYNRGKAIAYSDFFCNKVCSDGQVMSNTRNFRKEAGTPISGYSISSENDCTHFISSCLGRPPSFRTSNNKLLEGGGIYLDPSGFFKKGTAGVYGILNPSPLVLYLKVTHKIAFAHILDGQIEMNIKKPQFFANNVETIEELKGLIQEKFSEDGGVGDFVAYFSKSNINKAGHAALIVNEQWGISCHTSSRCGDVPISNVGFPLFIYVRIKEKRSDFM